MIGSPSKLFSKFFHEGMEEFCHIKTVASLFVTSLKINPFCNDYSQSDVLQNGCSKICVQNLDDRSHHWQSRKKTTTIAVGLIQLSNHWIYVAP